MHDDLPGRSEPLRDSSLITTKLRPQENSDVLGNVGRELRMLRGELARRILPPLPRAFAAAA